MNNLEAKLGINIRNTFDFEVYDAKTKELKATYKSHNIVLNGFINHIVNINTGSRIIQHIYIGDGTGNLSPDRTSLFHHTYSFNTSNVSLDENKRPMERVVQITLDENSGNGEITEVGLVGSAAVSFADQTLYTHSLITDSEGNQISITKTNLDIMIIRATLYGSVENDVPHFKAIYSDLPMFWSHLPQRVMGYGSNFGNPGQANVTFLGIKPKILQHLQDYSVGIIRTDRVSDVAARHWRFPITLAASEGNAFGTYMIKALMVGGVGYVEVTPDVFPPSQLTDITIGVGDGIMTGFDLPIPEVMVGNEIVYIDGVEQAKSSYEFTGKSMQFAQAWETADHKYWIEGTGVHGTSNSCFFPFGVGYGISLSAPIEFDFGEPKTINAIYKISGNATINNSLHASDDRENWVSVFTLQAFGIHHFTPHTARYWRINSGNAAINNPCVIGEYKPCLRFNTPPPEDAVITADIYIEYPIKNSNWQVSAAVNIFF